MERFSVQDLQAGGRFSKPVFLDPKFVLLSPETPVGPGLQRSLIQWEFRELWTDGAFAPKSGDDSPLDGSDLVKAAAEGSSILPVMETVVSSSHEAEILKKVNDAYQRFTVFVDQVFTRYVTREELNPQEIATRIKELCDLVREHRRYVLRIQDQGAANRNYLVSHSVKSAILAIVMGTYLKLQPHKLIELGVAALLHEIGMVRLPPQVYMTDKQLSPAEKKSILTHPVMGYKILHGFDFSLPVCLAALEHHERNNGAGYPRNITSDKISPFGKIIAVACSYDALTSARPYKNAKGGYEGMVDMLKNEGKQYEENIIKALVCSLSVFPIGSYVLLSDGRPAMVVDSAPDNPRFPMVKIMGTKGGTDKEAVLKTSQAGVSVKKSLMKEEAEALAASQRG